MSEFKIPNANLLSYHSIPRNHSLQLDIANHCDFPSRVLVIDREGMCFVCACEAWLPITVGHITDFEHLIDIWQSPVALALQQDIDNKKFTHCAVDRCGIIHKNQTAAEYCGRSSDCYYISVNIDDSCNLSCPSCRDHTVMQDSGPEYLQRLSWVQHLLGIIESSGLPVHIVLSGNGDPLASHIYRPVLHSFKPGPGQTIRLFTNGLLLAKQLKDNPITANITQYFISIDAGSSEVYEQVRRGGRWDILLANLGYLKDLAAETGAEVLLKFVLQQSNYMDMQNFVAVCVRYGFSGIINRLEDWGTWPGNYSAHDVIGNELHPEHPAAISELRRVYSEWHDRIQFNSSLADLCR